MTSVAIVSNCQGRGLAEAMALLLPGHAVDAFNIGLVVTPEAQEAALATVAARDLVFVMPFGRPEEAWSDRGIRRVARRAILLPCLIFRGFHPDTTYLPPPLVRAHPSPIGDYHSIIALAGFVSGRTVAETVRLFNPLAYARLGFLDGHGPELAELVRQYAGFGLGIGAALAGWRARGCFMLSINHPDRHVLHDLARAALAHAGVATAPGARLDLLPDTLDAHARFPVYPEIAARLGIAGSTAFKLPTPPGHDAAFIGLEAFVAGSFASYTGARPAALAEAVGVRRALAALG